MSSKREERLKRLAVRCPCCRKGIATRSPQASRNELATAVEGASVRRWSGLYRHHDGTYSTEPPPRNG